MGTWRSKTYKCGFIQCPVSISCLLYLSFKIQVAFARVCYCDFSIVTHTSQYLNLKIAMHFVYGQKLCHFLPIIRSFFVFILFLITEVLLLTDSKRRRFSPTKSFAHQVFTGKVFIFFILLFFIAGKTPYQRIER